MEEAQVAGEHYFLLNASSETLSANLVLFLLEGNLPRVRFVVLPLRSLFTFPRTHCRLS